MTLIDSTEAPAAEPGAAAEAVKACAGPCGLTLPVSSFGLRRKSKDGLFHLCKECRREVRGPRGREGRSALSLETELADLLDSYAEPALSDVLTRALDEVRQIGATGERHAQQVGAVRAAVLCHGCRRVEEVVEETHLSRWVVEQALKLLVERGELEPRDAFRLGEENEEAGRPATEYHPRAYPSGDGFRRFFRREDEDELEVEP